MAVTCVLVTFSNQVGTSLLREDQINVYTLTELEKNEIYKCSGGMGAYSPAPVLTRDLQSVVMETIIRPTVKGMAAEGCKFVGVLYAGLMIEKKTGLPKLIEYNVRFGDPECQVSDPLAMLCNIKMMD